MIAADVMTRTLISIPPDATIEQAVDLMLEKRISGLFVIDASGALQGILTEGDLLHRGELGTERHSSWFARLFAPGREAADFTESHSRKVGDLMTPEVLTVEENTDLPEVVRIMERNGVKRVGVVKDGNLTGVITRSNLLRGLSTVARGATGASTDDRTIKTAIEAALARESWAPVARIDLTVKDGQVEIWGTITSEDERRAVCVIAENTPGVKAVIDHMMFMDLYSGTVIDAPADTPDKPKNP